MGNITKIQLRLYRVPLGEVLSDAKHGDHTHFELVTVTVRLANGTEGTGLYLYRRQGRVCDPRHDRA